jgi:hypothetical protein
VNRIGVGLWTASQAYPERNNGGEDVEIRTQAMIPGRTDRP